MTEYPSRKDCWSSLNKMFATEDLFSLPVALYDAWYNHENSFIRIGYVCDNLKCK